MIEEFDTILSEDALGKLGATMHRVVQSFGPKWEEYNDVYAAIQEAKNLSDLDFETPESIERTADALGVPLDRLSGYVGVAEEMQETIENALDYDVLKDKGARLLEDVAEEITLDTFSDIERPSLVFYTAEWCMPCNIVKPTLARLAPHLDVPLYFSTDSELKRQEIAGEDGSFYVPQLVAYTKNAKVTSDVPMNSAKDLWDRLQGLVNMTQTYEGKGEFVCEDGTCTIRSS